MGKVHTNYVMNESDHEPRLDTSVERTDVNTSPSKLSQLLGGVNLWTCNPIRYQRWHERQPQISKSPTISNREQQTT